MDELLEETDFGMIDNNLACNDKLKETHAQLEKYCALCLPSKWTTFYKKIKDSTWPACENWKSVLELPEYIQNEILFYHIPEALKDSGSKDLITGNSDGKQETSDSSLQLEILASNVDEVYDLVNDPVLDYYLDRTDFQLTHIADCGGAQVPFHPSMTANGHVHWKMFLKVIEMIAPDKIFNHCLDWCSGPGFIGYSILSKGYCKQLDLADVWLPALNASQMVQGCPPARAWHIQRLNDIPSDVKYDLIVGNPPWSSGHIIDQNRKNCDPKFRIHQHFFEDVKKYLSPQGTIILLEELTYSGPSDFLPFLEHSGLKITKIIANYQHNYWFPIIQHG